MDHEPLRAYAEPAAPPSERSFGLTFAVLLNLVGLVKLWHGHGSGVVWLAVTAVFLGPALFRPALLAPLNRLWFRFGALLHGIVNPLIMTLMFYGVIVPVGFVLQRMGKNLLQLQKPQGDTYWTKREAGFRQAFMKQQF